MHIIREEMEEDIEDEVAAAVLDIRDSGPVAGGLSRAFSKTASAHWGRTLSLHNLLDHGIVEGAAPQTSPNVSQQKHASPLKPTSSSPASQQKHHQQRRSSSEKAKHAHWDRKQEVIDGINDLIEELKDIDNAIAVQAPEHIHASEIILTFGYSRTVLHFMRRAREKRDFQAVVAEAAPTLQGHLMAKELAEVGIVTTAIPDSSIFAMMARVNKVIVTAHALLADGGVMAPVGMRLVAQAAKRFSVPFVVLVGIYKLSPLFPHEPGVTFNDFKDPSVILPYQDQAMLEADFSEDGGAFLQVHNPSYDYIPPDLISLFVTDHGHGFMPSYVYRMLSEYYHRQDYQSVDV